MRILSLLIGGLLLAAVGTGHSPAPATASDDARQLVSLPEMMQEHMLANMRDHLLALDEILGELAEDDIDTAAKIAEQRLGMSSLTSHRAEHMAKFMPEGMRAMGTQMHRAASQFAIGAQDAEFETGTEARREIYGTLQKITSNCNACHQSYRIR